MPTFFAPGGSAGHGRRNPPETPALLDADRPRKSSCRVILSSGRPRGVYVFQSLQRRQLRSKRHILSQRMSHPAQVIGSWDFDGAQAGGVRRELLDVE
jgi:hypothetical protein